MAEQPSIESVRETLKRYPGAYAAVPGSGPKGMRCRDCKHMGHSGHRSHPKCFLAKWTRGDATTIRTSAPACSRFAPPSENTP